MLTSLGISILVLYLETNHKIVTKKDRRIKKMTGKLKNIEGDDKDVGAKGHQNVIYYFILF